MIFGSGEFWISTFVGMTGDDGCDRRRGGAGVTLGV